MSAKSRFSALPQLRHRPTSLHMYKHSCAPQSRVRLRTFDEKVWSWRRSTSPGPARYRERGHPGVPAQHHRLRDIPATAAFLHWNRLWRHGSEDTRLCWGSWSRLFPGEYLTNSGTREPGGSGGTFPHNLEAVGAPPYFALGILAFTQWFRTPRLQWALVGTWKLKISNFTDCLRLGYFSL